MNINQVSENIKSIKYPLIFLFRLLSYGDIINDRDMSIIIRLYLSHHHIVSCEVNLKKSFKNMNKPMTIKVINDFYKFMKQRFSIIFMLKNFSTIYINKNFWKLSCEKQIQFLNDTKLQFMAIYDCSRGGMPFHYTIAQMLNNIDTRITIKERLHQILKMFGRRVFETLEIPIIDCEYFEDLTNEQIIKYLMVIYDKIKEMLERVTNLMETYDSVISNIKALYKPIHINIVTDTVSNSDMFN
jgi:hypothetical protein